MGSPAERSAETTLRCVYGLGPPLPCRLLRSGVVRRLATWADVDTVPFMEGPAPFADDDLDDFDEFDANPPTTAPTRLPLDAPFTSPAEARDAVRRWLAATDAMSWSGKQGATDLAVCEALGAVALRCGGPVFSVGIGQLAIDAGMHRNTARLSLMRLEEKGLLMRIQLGGGTAAPRWRLLRISSSDAAREPQSWVGEDWARWGALGKTGGIVFHAAVGATMKETVDRCDFKPKTVRRVLHRLEALKVLVRDENGVYQPGADPTECAELFNTAGFRERDTQRLEAQRIEQEELRRRFKHEQAS